MLASEFKTILRAYCERTGSSISQAARTAQLHPTTFYLWRRKPDDYSINVQQIIRVRYLETLTQPRSFFPPPQP